MVSENIPMNFPCPIILKFIGLPYTLNIYDKCHLNRASYSFDLLNLLKVSQLLCLGHILKPLLQAKTIKKLI